MSSNGNKILSLSILLSLFTAAQGASVLHLGLEELVEFDLGWLMHFLYAFGQIERVIVLRIQLAVKLGQYTMHTVRQPPRSTKNSTTLSLLIMLLLTLILCLWACHSIRLLFLICLIHSL